MKLAGCFLLIICTLILRSVAVYESPEDWIKNRKLKAICFLKYPNDNEWTLRRNCRHTTQEIEVLDEEARANVTILSRSDRGVVLNFEPAIYIVEGRREDGIWRFMETLPQNNDPDHLQTTWTYRIGPRDTNVQLRFYRATSTGISKPETMQIESRRR